MTKRHIYTGIGCLVVLAVCTASFLYIESKKTYGTYSLTQKILFIIQSPSEPSDRMFEADTVHVVGLAETKLQNPYAYRLYVAALMARTDASNFNLLHSGAEVQCLDDMVAHKVYPHFFAQPDCVNTPLTIVADAISLYIHNHSITIDGNPVLQRRPSGAQYWSGEKPLYPEVALWSMLTDKISEKDTPQPFEANSKYEKDELRYLLDLQKNRTKEQIEKSIYWANKNGAVTLWFSIIDSHATNLSSKNILKYKTVAAISGYDATIEAWYLKYTFWTPRPFMRSKSINPAIDTPNFPGYPSGHSTIAGAISEAITACGADAAYANMLSVLAKESGDSRVWAGIHFQKDNVDGLSIGHMVGDAVARKFCN